METFPKIFGLVTFIICGMIGLLPSSSGATISLESAVKSGKVEMTIVAIGGSTGDTILLKLRRRVDHVLQLTLESGTVFTSSSGSVQNMVAAHVKGESVNSFSYRPTRTIVLRDDEEHDFIVEAYCLDFHKDNPGSTDSFLLSSVDTRAKKILELGEKVNAHMNVIQSAIWIDRDNVSASTLKRRFRVGDAEIAQAKSLLEKVELPK